MIVADSANKREIQDLRAAGLNVIPAKKGPGSIQTGLRAMLGYTLIIDPDSKNLVKELSNYVWNDRKSDTPVDEYNHLIDAARYAYTRLTLGKSSGVRKVN
jgi:phage terminase large subunit